MAIPYDLLKTSEFDDGEMLNFQKNLFSGQLREGYPRPRYILSTLDTMMNISEMKI